MSNPYPHGSSQRKYWHQGYFAQQGTQNPYSERNLEAHELWAEGYEERWNEVPTVSSNASTPYEFHSTQNLDYGSNSQTLSYLKRLGV